jgi:hypothetical protein
MWIFWSLVALVSMGLIIWHVGSLVRDKISGVAAHGGEGAAGQSWLLKAGLVASCIGLVIIWGTLVYALIDNGGLYLMQPWQHLRVVAWSLFCTALVLRTRNSVPAFASWRPSYRLAYEAFYMILFFGLAFAYIADLY